MKNNISKSAEIKHLSCPPPPGITVNRGFTLAEVLITLGIIASRPPVVLPTLVRNYQKMVLKNQFRQVYSQFMNAIKLTQAQAGAPIDCYYWDKVPTGICQGKCIGWNEYGSCNKWSCSDGSPLPSNANGYYYNCVEFHKNLFFKNLKTIKYCENHALQKGCIPSDYRGIDIIKKENNPNPDYVADPTHTFSDINIKNNRSAAVLANGVIIILYDATVPIYLVDINGHKKPNKYGHDIFEFATKGNTYDGITKIGSYGMIPIEKGGMSTSEMIKNAFR